MQHHNRQDDNHQKLLDGIILPLQTIEQNLAKQRQKFGFINLKIINEALGGIKEVKVSTNEKKIYKY